jgi:quercetin dioxygenase-like cupin family protein
LELKELFQELTTGNKVIVALPGRIEVTDEYGPLHYHNGATIVFITSGFGLIRVNDTQNELVRAGDIVLIPPRAKHLSVAAKGTTMIEHIVFLGAAGDLQAVET